MFGLRVCGLAHDVLMHCGGAIWRFEKLLNLRMGEYLTTSRLSPLVDFDLYFFIQDFAFVGSVARWSVLGLILLVALANRNLRLVHFTTMSVVSDELVLFDVARIGNPLHSTHLRVLSTLANLGNWNAPRSQTDSLLAVIFRSLILDQGVRKHAHWPIDSRLHRCFFPVLPLSWLF